MPIIPSLVLTNQNPVVTFSQLVTTSGSAASGSAVIADGLGNQLTSVQLTSSYATTASFTVSSSFSVVSYYDFSASFASASISSSYSKTTLSSSYSPTQLPDITDNTSSHYIGINQTNPQFPLDVNGPIGNSHNTTWLALGGNNTLAIGDVLNVSNNAILNTDGTNFSFGPNGVRVGIGGITNPTNSLDVNGNISCSVITASLFNGTINSSLTASYLSGSAISCSNYFGNTLTLADTVTTNSFGPNTVKMFVSASEQTAASDALYILPGGGVNRVQFGTGTNQFYALDLTNTQNILGFTGNFVVGSVQGVGSGVTLFYNNSDTEYTAGSYGFQPNIGSTYPVLFDRVNNTDSTTAIGYVIRTHTAITSSGGKFMIWENGLNGSIVLTTLSNGNFGINGITNPTNSLDVKGNISCSVVTASIYAPQFIESPYSSSAKSLTPTIQTGSMYFVVSGSNMLLYAYNGLKWVSSSMST